MSICYVYVIHVTYRHVYARDTYIYIYIYMHVCVYICLYIYIYVYVYVSLYVCVYTYIYIYIYIYYIPGIAKGNSVGTCHWKFVGNVHGNPLGKWQSFGAYHWNVKRHWTSVGKCHWTSTAISEVSICGVQSFHIISNYIA